ncbi:cyclin-dependent kinase 4 inhibitor B-like [Odontesthes bonariensis]|uniref:cyclin-dependent kinase 4 inhibitor B-like n=1 Tax=Odontesthes bonariensis TaxID=219752 RepID=UPI003F58B952
MALSLEDKLTAASANGNVVAVRELLTAGADVNGKNSFGHSAVQVMMMGSTPVAQALLEHGADPNVADGTTVATPLHDSARAGFLDTVRLLVKFQANPQVRDREMRLPADLARQNGYEDVVAFLESL